jgi:hypothetical protein
MNYDRVKYCWSCHTIKPRDEVLSVRPGSRRMACKQCREKAEKAQELRERERA